MPEQVLRIEPEHELKFKGPFNVPSTTFLKLTNPSEKRVVFKIKTTAPKRYCVRPNAGLLEVGQSASIAVVFQPCELEPTANKHKFMVQALFAPEGDVNVDVLWKDVDNNKLMDTKLRCTFEIPTDSGVQNDLNVTDEKITRSKHEDVSAVKAHKTSASDENRGVSDATARIQHEYSQIRQENSQLKDELERVKRQLKSREGNSGMAMQSANPPAVPMVYIVLALIAVLIGLVMGKFIL